MTKKGQKQKSRKGLSDKKLIRKYESGKINFDKALKTVVVPPKK